MHWACVQVKVESDVCDVWVQTEHTQNWWHVDYSDISCFERVFVVVAVSIKLPGEVWWCSTHVVPAGGACDPLFCGSCCAPGRWPLLPQFDHRSLCKHTFPSLRTTAATKRGPISPGFMAVPYFFKKILSYLSFFPPALDTTVQNSSHKLKKTNRITQIQGLLSVNWVVSNE